MRHLTFLLLAFSFLNLSASGGGCGTVAPSNYQHESTLMERMNYIQQQNSSRSSIRWVGVAYHIITKDDGTGGAPLKDVLDTHCELNGFYNVFNIGFYIVIIDTIKNTTLWNFQNQNLSNSAFTQYNVANVCNIFVDGNLPGLCGFATFPNTAPNKGGVFLNKDCVGEGTRTLPHEMGHFFNLLHTFDTTFGIEYVDGSNCSTAGDGFCDTPADFIDYRSACPYTGDSTDPHGDLYRTVIDPTILMSYFDDDCVNRFSNEEQAEINTTLSGSRAYLLNQTMPDTSPLDSAAFISPSSGTIVYNSPSLTFKWNAVARAQFYRFHLQSATSSVVFVDTLIRDTAFTFNNLLSGKKYKYRVKAISYGNTCGENANFETLQFSLPSSIENLEENVSMKIFPNPASDVSSLNLQVTLNENTNATVSLLNVNGEIVQQFQREFVEGTNDVLMNIERLSSGIYFVQFKSNKATKTERVSVIK